MRPAARTAFLAHVERYEGRIPHLYRDTHEAGLVTCGVGCLVDARGPGDHSHLALGLPWRRPDGELASEEEIRADWRRVKVLPRAMVASRYRSDTGLHLADEDIDALRDRRVASFWATLLRYLPELEGAPAPAQLATLDMAWALGPAFQPDWPRFTAAVRAGDWSAAAEQCAISTARAERNARNRSLLLAAANADDPEEIPTYGIPTWGEEPGDQEAL